MKFGDRLRHLRETNDLEREDIAKILNISYSAISKYETNVRFPDQEILKKIADYFNVSTDYLLGRVDERNLNKFSSLGSIDIELLGKRIKELRNEKDVTQEQMGKILNIAKSTISQYENNINTPDATMLNNIANYFNVSVDYLLGRTDIKNNQDTNNNQPILSDKDEKDIAKQLEKTMELLDQQDSIMFDGEAMDEETKELLRQSLENSMRMAKAINKKYTPKKYRK